MSESLSTSDEHTPLHPNDVREALGLVGLGRGSVSLMEGVGAAAFLIRDAVLGLVENPSDGAYNPYINPDKPFHNSVSIVCQRLCARKIVRFILRMSVFVLILVTFLEPPNWCLKNATGNKFGGSCAQAFSLWGPAAGDSNLFVQYYPNTSTSVLTERQAVYTEWVSVSILWSYLLLCIGRDGLSLRRYFRRGGAQRVRITETFALTMLTGGLIVDMASSFSYPRAAAPYWRLIILIASSRSSQREIETLFRLVPDVFNCLLLLFAFVVLYAWIGVVMFYETPEGEEHFPNLIDGMWTLWIAVTTSNYPDLMMPAFNSNRLTTIFFISFMIVTYFFTLNVILAIVVNAYDNELVHRQEERARKAHANLNAAFDLMDPRGTGSIDRATVMALFLVLNDDFLEIRTIPDDEAALHFAVLDRNGSEDISREEFLNFGKVMLIEFEKEEQVTLVEQYLPWLYKSACFQAFCRLINSFAFEIFIDASVIAFACAVAFSSYPFLLGQSVKVSLRVTNGRIDTVWEGFETALTAIYAVETVSKILLQGWKQFSRSNLNRFDMLISLLAVLSTIYVYYPNQFFNSFLIRYVLMVRVLRVLRWIQPFQTIARVGVDVLNRATPTLLLLFCVAFFFAALGVQVFGGMITRDPANPNALLLVNSLFGRSDYWGNNFNDMVGAMNVLFNLLVVNNWPECYSGFEAVAKSQWPRLYFLAFYIWGVILANNLVIAFVINAFIKEWSSDQEERQTGLIETGEALIQGQTAVLDASEVTGTATHLSGRYIARVRRPDHDGSDSEVLYSLLS